VGRTLQFVSGKYGLLKKSYSFNFPAFSTYGGQQRNNGREDQQYELIGPLKPLLQMHVVYLSLTMHPYAG
jgi:hypothetical protein